MGGCRLSVYCCGALSAPVFLLYNATQCTASIVLRGPLRGGATLCSDAPRRAGPQLCHGCGLWLFAYAANVAVWR